MNDALVVFASLILVPLALLGGLYAAHCYEENRMERLERLKDVAKEAMRLCALSKTHEKELPTEIIVAVTKLDIALRWIGRHRQGD